MDNTNFLNKTELEFQTNLNGFGCSTTNPNYNNGSLDCGNCVCNCNCDCDCHDSGICQCFGNYDCDL